MNQSQQSAKVGTFHAVPYPLPGRENQSIDRTPVRSEVLTVDLTPEMKSGFSGNVLVQFTEGKISGILRPPRKPVFTDTKKLERKITQAEHKIKNSHVPEIEKLKTKNHYSDMERVQKIVDQARANVKAWQAEIGRAQEAERDYMEALASLNAAIKNAVK